MVDTIEKSDVDKEAAKLWEWFLKGSGGAPLANEVKDYAFAAHTAQLEAILGGPDRIKNLALSRMCARLAGEAAAAFAKDDGVIDTSDFDAASQYVRDEHNQGQGGPLC